MRVPRASIAAFLVLAAGTSPACGQEARPRTAEEGSAGPFVVKPYVQLGDAPKAGTTDSLMVLWHADDAEADWKVEYRAEAATAWRIAEAPAMRRVAVEGIEPHRVYGARLSGLLPGGEVAYRVKKGGEVVFEASTRARKAADQAHRFVAFGDCGAGTDAANRIAYRAHLARPDYVMIAGDIVYSRGRISEYRKKYWPVYNADEASPELGAPLLRSIPFLAAPGNHDIATRDLGTYPDGLAYFLYWAQPLNGPHGTVGAPQTPTLQGPESNQRAFLAAAGAAYPRMANFSFDYGNVHWTVLDANSYVDWTDPALRAWIERDLASARGATWRLVIFHQPGFNSSKSHFNEQRTRLLAPVFERGGVDLVIAGHVHNYQRTFPLRFVAEEDAEGRLVSPNGRVGGRWTLDRAYDGQTKTRPSGVIYLVSGAGGANLYNPEQQDDPGSWQEFTHKFLSKIHSLTVADVDGTTLTVRQVSEAGDELDRFTLTK